ncbi:MULTISPECIES: hypothetical protein [unclassified Xanthomonas]|nr:MULTISPECIES: hypothetical protein [unclassified Xanthomonas]MEA9566078.1 hypothetical protein [Xanthomonas sp. WHRI 8932A]MEA9635367.1 hypothetical protein [Xanthomonas sp. WHRI 8812E]
MSAVDRLVEKAMAAARAMEKQSGTLTQFQLEPASGQHLERNVA